MAKSLFEKIVDRSVDVINENDLSGLINIGENAFSYCNSLTNATLPEGLTSIGIKAFTSCKSLIDITLPDSLINIEQQAFGMCSSLPKISVPKGVSNIGNLAFSHSTGSMAITDAYFYQPSGMTITLPTAGSNYGMFYVKTARSMNIYTDNETIKNYAWSSDNITPTFYHLDGTAW